MFENNFDWKAIRKFLLTGIVATVFLGSASGLHAAEVSGIAIPDTARVGDQTLQLNGAGIRYAAAGIVRVYVASVYLPKKQAFRSEAEFDAVPGAKRVQLHFLRDVGSNEFSRALMAGVRANLTSEERLSQLDSLVRLGVVFGQVASISKGGVITVDRDGKTGASTIYVNGKQIGETFPHPGFFNALMKIWLGPKPIEPSMKPVLLGTVASNDNNAANDTTYRN